MCVLDKHSRIYKTLLVVALVLFAPATTYLHAQTVLHYHPGSTRKVSQLTGEYDQPWALPTRSLSNTQASLGQTDLGSTLEHNGSLVFLFGDTWGGRAGLQDSWGITASTNPWNVNMQVPLAGDGIWRSINPPGLNLAEFCVPSHGISVNGVLYVVFTQPGSNGDIMKKSWMISSANNGITWQTLYQLDNNTENNPRFVNVWLQEHGDYIYMFGSGAYRASSPYLARALKTSFPTKSAWQYYMSSTSGNPQWTPNPSLAGPVFSHNQLGEFSCSYVPQLSCWVMLYNSASPRGIVMRTASNPWGTWSSPQVIMNPFEDQAYGNFMHINWEFSQMDTFSDPGRENQWGGEYGPYLIPRFTSGDSSRCELYYTMSTWNPYQVVIMRSIVSATPPPTPPATVQRTLGHDLWTRSPADIGDPFTVDGRAFLTTYDGDKKTGWLWQKLPVGTTEVSFLVHGGQGEIFLLENSSGLPPSGSVQAVDINLRSGVYGRVVRRATGVNSNETSNSWTWDTRGLDTSSLVMVVLDSRTDSWGFVSFSDLTIQAPEPASAVADWTMY